MFWLKKKQKFSPVYQELLDRQKPRRSLKGLVGKNRKFSPVYQERVDQLKNQIKSPDFDFGIDVSDVGVDLAYETNTDSLNDSFIRTYLTTGWAFLYLFTFVFALILLWGGTASHHSASIEFSNSTSPYVGCLDDNSTFLQKTACHINYVFKP